MCFINYLSKTPTNNLALIGKLQKKLQLLIYITSSQVSDSNFLRCCFVVATRETAFIHAISSAAITHEITHQCRQGNIPGCSCAKVKKQRNEKDDWQWGGCSDNSRYGEKETKRFIDRLENGNDARTAFNLHNNEVGRKVRDGNI